MHIFEGEISYIYLYIFSSFLREEERKALQERRKKERKKLGEANSCACSALHNSALIPELLGDSPAAVESPSSSQPPKRKGREKKRD